MISMLKYVGLDVKYDAWHRFGIVNQLRFLGLLDESQGSQLPDKQIDERDQGMAVDDRRVLGERLVETVTANDGAPSWQKLTVCTIAAGSCNQEVQEAMTGLGNAPVVRGAAKEGAVGTLRIPELD